MITMVKAALAVLAVLVALFISLVLLDKGPRKMDLQELDKDSGEKNLNE